jgi:isopenicillin N synthase-like dioxygenase
LPPILTTYHFIIAHTDIGLLSLVFGDKPGLEVFDRRLDSWYPIEQVFLQPTASVLVGKQLFHLTNRRYRPGAHRVVSLANPPPSDPNAPPTPKYRYSIVFILRAHSPIPINTSALTTPFTGKFDHPMTGMTAHDLYKEISRNCFNINIDPEIRKVQKEKMRRRAEEAATKRAEEAPSKRG